MAMNRLVRGLPAVPFLCVAAFLAATHAIANPTGPTVVHGNATLSTSGNTLTVTNSPGAIINWQRFGIASQEITRFLQQSGASAVLNRVTGGNPSAILGQLQSNGAVFLVNPNGVVFGAGAQVNTTSFTATTGQISDGSFLAGTAAPNGGATITVGGPLRVSGSAALTSTTATIEGGITAEGNLSITAAGSINVNGGISAHNITLVSGSGTSTGGSGISVGGGVTLTTPGSISGGTIVLTSGSSVPVPTSASPATGKAVSVVFPQVMPNSPAQVSRALFVLEKREPRF
jgi:filamentous hemagglutinin family protein